MAEEIQLSGHARLDPDVLPSLAKVPPERPCDRVFRLACATFTDKGDPRIPRKDGSPSGTLNDRVPLV
jgi:hypothetical protein